LWLQIKNTQKDFSNRTIKIRKSVLETHKTETYLSSGVEQPPFLQEKESQIFLAGIYNN
jgi:hypothetical protein